MRGTAPGAELEAELAAAEGVLGVSGQVSPRGRTGGGQSWEGSKPYLFLCSSSRFAAFHSEPCEHGEGVTGPLPQLQQAPPPSPQPAAHQVEVGEDAGRPVLLGHEEQHLVVDEVAVLLERASQAQLQGLADLQAGG